MSDETSGNVVHRYFNVTLFGRDSMLQCGMDLDREAAVRKWWSDPLNKDISVKADDRSPAWTWISRMYHNDKNVIIPTDVVQACLSNASGVFHVPNGKGARFKSLVNSCLVHIHPHWEFTIAGGDFTANSGFIPVDDFLALEAEQNNDFDEYVELAAKHGFKLMVKSVKIQNGRKKQRHIRVRPWFFNWQAHGQIVTTHEALDQQILQRIFTYAGQMKGIGDWRPSTGGPYGAFSARVEEFNGF